MRVLVVGCGYVGTPLGAELVRQGHEVYGVRRSDFGQSELESAGITPLRADISKPETLTTLPRPADWVVHCVSASGGGTAEYRRTYLDGTRNLLNWLAAAPPRKLVYTGSTGVYGQDDGSPVDETSITDPTAETARILVEAERIIIDASRQTGFPGVILRVAGIYGPGRGHWLKQFLAGTARLEGNRSRILNMIHRDDVVGAILAGLRSGRPGEVYNAVDEEPVSQLALFEWLAQKLGRSWPPVVPEEPAENRKRGVTNKIVSNGRLKVELGYRFKYPTFREGFTAELEHYPHLSPRETKS